MSSISRHARLLSCLSSNIPLLARSPAATSTDGAGQQQPEQSQATLDAENKRRPGRPKGSRNRKPRDSVSVSAKAHQSTFHSSYPAPTTAPPPVPGLTPQNQQYYEFQWRVLNLCSEFYGAAEELVKATSPVVIHQSYQMGPSHKVDPLAMLGDAKRICDSLVSSFYVRCNVPRKHIHGPHRLATLISLLRPPNSSKTPAN